MFKKFLKLKSKQINQNNCRKLTDEASSDNFDSDCDTLLVHPTLSIIDDTTDLDNHGKFITDSQNNSNYCPIIYQPNLSNYPNCCTNHMMNSLYKSTVQQPSPDELRNFRLDLYFKKYPPVIFIAKKRSKNLNYAATFVRYDKIKSFQTNNTLPEICIDRAKMIKIPPQICNYVDINHKKMQHSTKLIRQSFQKYCTPSTTPDITSKTNISSSYLTCKEDITPSFCGQLANLNLNASDSSSNLLSSEITKTKQTLNESSIISSIQPTKIENRILHELTFISSFLTNKQNPVMNIDDLTNVSNLTTNSLKDKYRKNYLFLKCINKIKTETSFQLSSVNCKTNTSLNKSRLPRRINQIKHRTNSSSLSFSSFLTDNTTISNFDESEPSISFN